MKREEFEEKIKTAEGKEKGSLLLQYSNSLLQHDSGLAVIKAKEALAIALKEKKDDFFVYCNIHLSYAYLYNHQYEEVLKITETILKKSLEIELPLGIGAAYLLKGDAYFYLQKFDESLENYSHSAEIYQKSAMKDKLLSVYNNIAKVHHYLGQIDKAYEYMELALEIGEEIDYPSCDTLRMNMGTMQYDQKDFDKALDLYKKTISSYHQKNQKKNEAFATFNAGLACGALEDFHEQLKYYDKAYKLLKELGIWDELSRISRSISEVYIEISKFDKALNFLKEAEEIALEHNLQKELISVYKCYSSCYEKQGNLALAIEYLKKYSEYNDEFQANIHKDKIAEIETKCKTEIIKYQNIELKQKNLSLNEQIDNLNRSVIELKKQHKDLQERFEETTEKLDKQDDILSQQTRQAVMGKMISQIAHQWKQPLNLIGVIMQSIQDSWEFDELTDEILAKNTNLIMDQVMYMAETIDDFRNFFKPAKNQSVDFNTIFKKAEKLFTYSLKKGNVTLEYQISPEIYFMGNPNDLIQVILNIINNAKEAMDEANIADKKISLTACRNGEMNSIKIFNEGTAIEKSVIDKIFAPYFSTKGDKGTGIGLYICKSIIENKYKGSLEVANRLGGVEFSIELPIFEKDKNIDS